MEPSNNEVKKLEDSQGNRILAKLEAAGLDFIVERVPVGWRVETEQRGKIEGYSCTGETLADALGQLTTVLTAELELELDEEDEIPNEPLPYELIEPAFNPPVEYCKRFVIATTNHVPVNEPEYLQYMSSELGENFIEAIAE